MGGDKFPPRKENLPKSKSARDNPDEGQNPRKNREFSRVISNDFGGGGLSDFWRGFGLAACAYLIAGLMLWRLCGPFRM
jgi:hypothetical protein